MHFTQGLMGPQQNTGGFNMNQEAQYLHGSKPQEIVGSGIEALKHVLADGAKLLDLHFKKKGLSMSSIDFLREFDTSLSDVRS